MICQKPRIAVAGVLCIIALLGAPAKNTYASPSFDTKDPVAAEPSRGWYTKEREGGNAVQYSIQLTSNQSLNIPFNAQTVIITNPTGTGVYVRVGGNDIPLNSNADIYGAPYSYIAQPINPSSRFGLALTSTTVGPTSAAAPPIGVTFSETPMPFQVANINNPNVAYQPQWTMLSGFITAGTSKVIVPARAGLSIVVYQLTVVYDNYLAAAVQFYWHYGVYSQATTLWPVYLWNNNTPSYFIKRDTDIISFQPNGFPLPVNTDLSLRNGDLVNDHSPYTGVLYSYK